MPQYVARAHMWMVLRFIRRQHWCKTNVGSFEQRGPLVSSFRLKNFRHPRFECWPLRDIILRGKGRIIGEPKSFQQLRIKFWL